MAARGGPGCQLVGIGEEGLHFGQLAIKAGNQLLVEIAHAMGVAGGLQQVAQVGDLGDGEFGATPGEVERLDGVGRGGHQVAAALLDLHQAGERLAAAGGVFAQLQVDRLGSLKVAGGQQHVAQQQ